MTYIDGQPVSKRPLLSSSDISALLASQPLDSPAVQADATPAADQAAPQGAAAVVVEIVAGCVAAVILVVSVAILGNSWRGRRRRQKSGEAEITQDTPGFMEVSDKH